MKAILLAGGKGTRLRPLTLHTPKPIVPIFDRPFLHYQIDLLRQVPEIDEVILSLNYQPRRIEEIFGDGDGLGLRIRYVVEPTPLGTGGAIRYAGDSLTRIGRRLQRRRADAGRPAARAAAAPRAQGQGDDRADAGREPARLRPGRDRRRRQRPALPREAGRRRDHLQHHQRRHLRPRAGDLRPHPEGHAPGRSSAATSRRSSSAARPSSPTSTTATGSTSARRRSTGRSHRDIMDGRYLAPPFTGTPRAGAGSRPSAQGRGRRRARGPCFIDDGVVVKAGAPDSALQRDRPAHARRGGRAVVDGVHPLAQRLDRPRGRRRRGRSSAATATSAATRPSSAPPSSATRPSSPTTASYDASIRPSSRPTTSAASTRPRSTRRPRARSAAPSSLTCRPKRIAVSRDMRLSSPSVAAAFIDGARAQGADVVDYGMMGTDMLYFAVAPRRPRRRRADHGVAQPEGVQRHQDGAPRGVPAQRRCRHRRHPRHDRRRPAPCRRRRARGRSRRGTCSTTTWST